MKNSSFKHLNAGFTLIELMIVIAIIGIMASIAIPSYKGYVNTTKMSLVKNNADQVSFFLKNSFSTEVTRQSLSLATTSDTIPVTEEALITFLNAKLSASSPVGGAAFSASADNDTGAIGITLNMSGATWRSGDSVQVMVPTYITMTGDTFLVTYK